MSTRYNARIVSDKLMLHLDAANPKSYIGSGTSWVDISGKGNNGTLTNGPTFSSDNLGSFVFDGTNDHVALNSSFQVSTSGTYSFEAWIYKTATGTNTISTLIGGGYGSDKDGIIIASEEFSAADNPRIYSVGGSGSTVAAIYYNGVSQPLNGSNTGTDVNYDLNQWIHIAVTGINVTSTDGGAHHIGQNNNNTNEFAGRIANLKVYDRELTATEVKQNYDALRGRFGL
tara:strand:+ start:2096 stop:2782 length:687 start_codon:yes stop_codon:yes gene_type:complete